MHVHEHKHKRKHTHLKVNGEIVDVAAALCNMALVYERKGEYEKAWELCARKSL